MTRDDRINADIPQQLATIAARQRWRRRVAMASAAVVIAVVALASILGSDLWLQRPSGALLRWGATLAAALVLGAIATWLARQFGRHDSPLAIARQLEEKRPARGSLFSSGWAFARGDPDDPRAGSAELRRATVMRAAVELDGLDPDVELAQPPWRRALVAALLMLAATAAVVTFAPRHMRVGATRLLNPWSEDQWPRRHVLQFSDAAKIAPRGGEFVAILTDANGTLPDPVTIEYRPAAGRRRDIIAQEFADVGQFVEWRRENLQESFEYRATGGDDRSMPWQSVTVASPPNVTHWAATVQPPAYTGLPVEVATNAVSAIAGSQVELHVSLSEPVIAARLTPPTETDGEAIEADVADDGMSAVVAAEAWQPLASGQYRLQVETSHGMQATAPQGLLVEVLPDRPPEIDVAAAYDNLTLLPSAALPLSIVARDDLGLAAVEIVVNRENGGSDSASGWIDEVKLPANEPSSAPTKEFTDAYLLDLSQLHPQPGDIFAVTCRTTDSLVQQTQCLHPIELQIVDRQRLFGLLAADLAELVDALLATEVRQRDALGMVEAIGEPQEPAALAAAQAEQSTVAELLIGPGASAAELAAELHFRYAVNGMLADGVAQQLDALQLQLSGRATELLDTIDRGLAALPNADSSAAAHAAQVSILDNQRKVLAIVAAAVAEFQQYSTLQQLQRDLAELAARQQSELTETEAAATEALVEGVAPTAEELRHSAADQREILWRLAGVLDRMEQVAERIIDAQPMDAARLAKALDLAERLSLRTLATTAADHLQAGRLAAAVDAQRAVAEGLVKLLAAFGAVDADEAAQKLAELKRLADEVAELRRQTEQRAAASPPPGESGASAAASKQAQDAAAQATALAQRAQRAAPAAEQPLTAAAKALQQPAKPRAAATAAKKLAQAEAAIAAAQQQQQTLLAELRLKRLAGEVDQLLVQQQAIVEHVGQLPRGATAEAAAQAARQQVSHDQTAVQTAAIEAADGVADLPVFVFGLRSAAAEMGRTSDALDAGAATHSVRSLAQSALRRLEQVAAAVAEHRAAARGAGSGAGEGATPQQRREAAQQQRSLALVVGQIRLLRGLQAELEERTGELRADGGADAAEQLQQLQAEQAELADLARELLQTLAQPDEAE
ncbi:MAG: hypothetical protein KDA44_04090 [Planctomycetales bacterium]|nr:hypothetical protein [Planctomycetales bacterium]